MRLSFMLFVALFLFFLSGCGGTYEAYDFENGGSSTETIGVKWQGEYTQSPAAPDTNWVYYNSRDSVVYLYSGTRWDTLAVRSAGQLENMESLDSVSLAWRGVRSEAPEDPKLHWAYRNRTLKTSFIWDSTSWAVLIKDSDPSSSLIWKGALTVQPANPQKNWAYFNTTIGKSYKFDGTAWVELDSENVTETVPDADVAWLGVHTTPPDFYTENDIYQNSVDRNSYIYCDTGFQLFAYNDTSQTYCDIVGLKIIWLGGLEKPPVNPEMNTAYYDSKLQSTFIWNGTEWAFLNCCNIASYHWYGVSCSKPADPFQSLSYFDPISNKSYTFDGSSWKVLSREDLFDKRFKWLGSLKSAPQNPVLHSVYHNCSNYNSYIYGENGFELFAFYDVVVDYSNLVGLSIIWHGASTEAPTNPSKNSVYYNSDRRITFIWNGTDWAVLYGYHNFPYSWWGALVKEPENPQKDWAYYNTSMKKSYFYSGNYWSSFSHMDLSDTFTDTVIQWLGAHAVLPEKYTENDIYYSTVDSNTYICNVGKFQLFSYQDVDADYSALEGLEITWFGSREDPPENPTLYTVYFDSDMNCPFIWNGTDWAIMHAYNLFPFNWRGVLMDAPENPMEKWAYFDSKEMMSYLYDGTEWKPFLREYAID